MRKLSRGTGAEPVYKAWGAAAPTFFSSSFYYVKQNSNFPNLIKIFILLNTFFPPLTWNPTPITKAIHWSLGLMHISKNDAPKEGTS
jgi:hypothetical protein